MSEARLRLIVGYDLPSAFVCFFVFVWNFKEENLIDPDKICEEIFLKFTNKLLMNM
jgi:hypothetical protein